jgi:dihydrofolate reductase
MASNQVHGPLAVITSEVLEFQPPPSDVMGAFLHGRVTYEFMAGYWPTADADPLDHWACGRVAEQVMELKAHPGGDLVLGGADLAATFMRRDLIDEYWLYVHPVVVGGGKPLFQASATRINLRLTQTRTLGNGVVLLRYQRPDAPSAT